MSDVAARCPYMAAYEEVPPGHETIRLVDPFTPHPDPAANHEHEGGHFGHATVGQGKNGTIQGE